MDIKNELSKILSLDGHKRRNTLRYLSKRNTDMWQEMIRLTSFLPDNSSAPQRAWHIMHDIDSIPFCAETNEKTKWISYDHGYTKTIDRSHKMKYQHKRGDFVHTYDEITNKKRSDSNKKTAEDGRRKQQSITPEIIDARTKKTARTCLERYGVDNYRKSEEFKIKQKEYYDEKFKEVRDNRTEREKYYEEVEYHTEKNWNEHFYKINPTRLERGPNLHLDHIYSRSEGFKNGIEPEIIGHWTNLRLISRIDNSVKRDRCDKTQNELLEDYKRSKVFTK
jgi:hypothetical protein